MRRLLVNSLYSLAVGLLLHWWANSLGIRLPLLQAWVAVLILSHIISGSVAVHR